jgi:hypothetical protein
MAAADTAPEDRRWLESMLMITADKPVENWSDEDVVTLEMNLADLSRRFVNLEALQKEVARDRHDGFEARRVTITRADGSEERRLVWLASSERQIVAHFVDKLMTDIENVGSEHERHVVALTLLERLLGMTSADVPPLGGTDIAVREDREIRRRAGEDVA